MRFAHIVSPAHSSPELVVPDGDELIVVGDLFDGAPRSLNDLIHGGPALLEQVSAAATAGARRAQAGVQFAPAVPDPPVVLAVGLNYAAHSGELGLRTDSTPIVFTLWPNSLSGHDATTSWPAGLSDSIDYEAELGVIIGKPAKDVAVDAALEHVWGYTVVNDITARNIQFAEAQWSRCKSFDGFTPVGPMVVTADEIPDPQDLHIWTVVDGELVQDAHTGQMIRTVAELVSDLSGSTTLLPGTLISTGSPGGAGFSRDPQVFLRDQSTVTVGVDGIGELTTHCRVTD